jgi:hypothetical protein
VVEEGGATTRENIICLFDIAIWRKWQKAEKGMMDSHLKENLKYDY